MLWLFVLTVFTSAALIFSVQPMYARLVLPLLGGSPAVWNTVVTFFQAVLLLGYGYVHFMTKRLGLRQQLLVHALVLAVPLVFLPVVLPDGATPPADSHPILWIYRLMAVTVGIPFFALSATAPLLQRWFAQARHERSKDPYFLYVASNAGSLLALLSYPCVIEPNLGLANQALWWMRGYWILVSLVGLSAAMVWVKRSPLDSASEATLAPVPEVSAEPVRWEQRWRWVFFAFVPSSLMLGTTTFISSEVAAIPLMWIVPLALYLLTYILAFAQRQFVSAKRLQKAQIFCLIAVAVLINMQATQPLLPLMIIHLVNFFVSAWVCHALLAASRPTPTHLTEFYLWMCFGGVLGGIFNSLVAPIVFSSVLEYPLAIVLVCFAVWWGSGKKEKFNRGDWLWPLVLFIGSAVFGCSFSSLPEDQAALYGLVFGLPALACFFFSERPFRFAWGVAAIFAAGTFYDLQPGKVLHVERSFFGVNRVTLEPQGPYHLLFHGRTLHGMQSLDVSRRREALTYYHATGPIGEVFGKYGQDKNLRVGLVGLGAGSLATYARPGQSWTFYEIDPVVEAIARNRKYFSYLSDAKAPIPVKLGDARVNLALAQNGSFQMLVLDAYSSDAIPIHLVTREAFLLYLQKLAPKGIIAIHISNLHLDLEPTFANVAHDLGLVAYYCDDTGITEAQSKQGKSPSQWLIMARQEADVALLVAEARWEKARTNPSDNVWTDDYSSIWSVFSWH
ncbi:MAG: fused MFS/spermidine synthase [Nibricoccus sp.]